MPGPRPWFSPRSLKSNSHLESNALEQDLDRGTESFAESLSYFPAYEDFRQGQEVYLSHIRRAKGACSIPILASLNGATASGWVRFAKEIEQAGADAIELNTYSRFQPGTATTVPRLRMELLALVRRVKEAMTIPIAVKLSPQFTSVPHLAMELDGAGANGLVLFEPLLSAGFRYRQSDCESEASHAKSPGRASCSACTGSRFFMETFVRIWRSRAAFIMQKGC